MRKHNLSWICLLAFIFIGVSSCSDTSAPGQSVTSTTPPFSAPLPSSSDISESEPTETISITETKKRTSTSPIAETSEVETETSEIGTETTHSEQEDQSANDMVGLFPLLAEQLAQRYHEFNHLSFRIDSDNQYELTIDEHVIPTSINIDINVRVIPGTGEMSYKGQIVLNTSGQAETIIVDDYILLNPTNQKYQQLISVGPNIWSTIDIEDAEVPFLPERMEANYFAHVADITTPEDETRFIQRVELEAMPYLAEPLMHHLSTVTPPLTETPMVMEIDTKTNAMTRLDVDLSTYIGQTLVNNYIDDQLNYRVHIIEGRVVLMDIKVDQNVGVGVPEALRSMFPNIGSEAALAHQSSSPSPAPVVELSQMYAPPVMSEGKWLRLGAPLYDENTGTVASDEQLAEVLEGIYTEVESVEEEDGSTTLIPRLVNNTEYVLMSAASTYRIGDVEMQVHTDIASVMPGERTVMHLGAGSTLLPDIVSNRRLDHSKLVQADLYFIDEAAQITLVSVMQNDQGEHVFSVTPGLFELEITDVDYTSLIPQNMRLTQGASQTLSGDIENIFDKPIHYYNLLVRNKEDGRLYQFLYESPIPANQMSNDIQLTTSNITLPAAFTPLMITVMVDAESLTYDMRLGRLIHPLY